jgi:hypothetical protein
MLLQSGGAAMINFPCLCGVKFSLGDEMAGEMFQCDKCGRLVVVPILDDLKNLGTDGTYDLLDAPAPKTTAATDTDPTAFDLAAPPRVAPRYDPFTGELIREHALTEHELSPVQKAPPRVMSLNKSKHRAEIEPVPPYSWLSVFVELLMAKNAAVLAMMLVLAAFTAFTMFLVQAWGAYLLSFVPLILFIAMAGYYSLIIQETGPGQKNELPTPLRTFEVRTDVWDPMVHFVVANLVWLVPAMVIQAMFANTPAAPVLGEILFAIGMVIFPAIFLTLAADGVLINLRPDRLLRVMVRGGIYYLCTLVGWIGGTFLLGFGWEGLFAAPSTIIMRPGGLEMEIPRQWLLRGTWPSFGYVLAGLYLQYYGCWLLGLIWRQHHAEFGWVAQRFIKEPPPLPGAPPPPGQQPHGTP